MSDPKIQIFTSSDGEARLEVALEQETVWLSQAQMAELFGTKRPAITKHLSNIFKSGELDEQATCSILEHMADHGQRYRTKHYSLDAIISVGYRVNSMRATQFRQWATGVLKQHLVQGYTLNQQRLTERGIEFEQAVALLSRTLSNQQLLAPAGEAVVDVIRDYARSWSLLQGYDEQSLTDVGVRQNQMQSLGLEEVLTAIAQLQQTLIAKGEATELFGKLRGDGLASALATIEQGFGDELFYPNVASRAAHLLYFVVMYRMYGMQRAQGCAGAATNHPLADGNKRTGSFLFLWYLRLNQHLLAKPVEQLINDNTLVALALLVAESLPDQKELMIRLVEHFVLLKDSTEEGVNA
ncbi:RhuM family protein [Aestuariirhabdus sp. LZHN29]|uniref:RhuM family protein n=1 Tax=Aestuariirhabdus sp. LZHN29 TaxID=3417462 RepID=UPI003CF4A317